MQQDLGRSFSQRYSRCYTWGVYLLWVLVVYAPVAVLVSIGNDTGQFMHPEVLFNCLLLIPVALGIYQMIYPTFCGWLIIFVPTVPYTLFAVFETVYMLLKTRLWDGWEKEDFGDACTLSVAAVVICFALVIVRPRLTPSTHVT